GLCRILAEREERPEERQDEKRTHGCIFSILTQRQVPGLAPDALEPALDRRVATKIEATVGRAMRIGVERDVGDAVAAAGKERLLGEMLLHHAEGLVPALMQSRQIRAPRRLGRQVVEDEARDRDVRLVAVLLEEHPLQYARVRQALAR